MDEYLLIAEKPSLMRAIKEAYEKHKKEFAYKIDFIAVAGHTMRLLLPSEINAKYKKWIINNYPLEIEYKYTIIKGKEAIYKEIKERIRSGRYKKIIHAGDADGEGELLVRLVLDDIKNPLPVLRFWNNNLNEENIIEDLKNMKEDKEYDGYMDAALLRQQMDYAFGMNLTGLITLKMGTLIKLGRVKGAMIRLIADREKEIENFVPRRDYIHTVETKGYVLNGKNIYPTEKEARETLCDEGEITSVEEKDVEKRAPELFKLSTAQAAAASLYGYNGSETLSIIQSLYEKKLVTYPRTDCEYLPTNTDVVTIINKIGDFINLSGNPLQNPKDVKKDKHYFNDVEVAKEGHTALIPTGSYMAELSTAEKNIYIMIIRRFVAIFGLPKKIHKIHIKGKANEEEYECKVEDEEYAGYELILNPEYELKHCNREEIKVGKIEDGKWGIKEVKAKCPSRYSIASFIKALDRKDKESGIIYRIGTPATRANIIEECIKCGYFTLEGKNYKALPLSKQLVQELGEIDIFNIETTARWATKQLQ